MENRILPAENEVVSERERLCRWLEDEAEDRMKQAISRSEMAKSARGATAKELRAAKMLAEEMAGHPLRGVSTDPADADRESDIQDRIAAKLEKEARLLSKWADLLRNSESAESRLAELSTIVDILRELYEECQPDGDRSPADVYYARVIMRDRLYEVFPKIAALVPPVEKGEK